MTATACQPGRSVIVVGGGVGGIACAARLAHAGHRVEVWEQGEELGGKLREVRAQGYRFDTGPSVLAMPGELRALYADLGEKLEDHLTLERLANGCRYHWRDGTTLDQDEAFWARPEVVAYLDWAQGIDALSGDAFLRHPPAEAWRALSWRSLPNLRHLPKVMGGRTLAEEVARRFADPHLRQLFGRFATYNGSSPYKTPATFSIIPYVEARQGSWYVRGGMGALARALVALAAARGVVFRTGTAARSWSGGELESADGRRARPDLVVCNQDVLAAAQGWLAPAYTARERAALLAPELSFSGFVLLLGVRHRHARLAHHNVFFSDNDPAEFDALFARRQPIADPTLYVAVTARSEPQHAPEGCDNLFVLANAPSDPAAFGPGESEVYAERIVARLEAAGLDGLSQQIDYRRTWTARDFAARDGSHRGALYGWASHGLRRSFLRPPLWSRRRKGLYFVGGTTHPGGGIPLVLGSARMVAERIAREGSR